MLVNTEHLQANLFKWVHHFSPVNLCDVFRDTKVTLGYAAAN